MKTESTSDRIRIEVVLAVPPRRAWSLLTQQEHLASWWGEHVHLDAKVGGRFVERWSDGGRHVVTSGTVLRCEPSAALELTWMDDDWPGETKVAFRLRERGWGTSITFEHSGWDVHPESSRSALLQAHASGWSHYLAALVEYAEATGR